MGCKLDLPPTARQECDYEQGGILYCGKCHTPKQCSVRLFGVWQIVPCLCSCAKAQADGRRAQEAETQRVALIAARRQAAFHGSPMMGWTFAKSDNKDKQLMSRMQAYVQHFREFEESGRGLMLYGSVGTGKTFAACCVVNALIDAGYTAKATNAAEIANGLLGTWNKEDYMAELLECDILLLDDLGIERTTEYMAETLYNVVDGRYRAGRPLIVTTNLTSAQLREPEGIGQQRIFSRIKERCIPLPVEGEDRRIALARSQFAADMQLLDSGINRELDKLEAQH